MLFAVAAIGIAVFGFTLWCSVTVARIKDLPRWRRYLPFALFFASNIASALRTFDLPEAANAVAFPLNALLVVVALAEMRASRQRRETSEPGSTV
ncbi:hypothetical protein ACH4ZU_20300 [Streptomyces sp. NPDC020472]|uniref:hypothetical protein n=1 Tax=Streptomyces sp. NPDC020472 TaxID=3365075 RepID=UPI003798F452